MRSQLTEGKFASQRAMTRLQGTARVYCAGECRKTRRPAMNVMPRTVDKAESAESAGAADLGDAGGLRP